MKHLNDYKIFESDTSKGKEASSTFVGLSISQTLRKLNITNYTINDDGSVDVDGNVFIVNKNIKVLPLKFNRVNGHFNCSSCNLTSLEGAPKYVHGNFDFHDNKITSLEGSPEYVGGDFYCMYNPIYCIARYFIYRAGPKKRNNLIELFNYYDIVQDRNVIYDRLKYFYETINIELTDEYLKDIKNNGYKIIR